MSALKVEQSSSDLAESNPSPSYQNRADPTASQEPSGPVSHPRLEFHPLWAPTALPVCEGREALLTESGAHSDLTWVIFPRVGLGFDSNCGITTSAQHHSAINICSRAAATHPKLIS